MTKKSRYTLMERLFLGLFVFFTLIIIVITVLSSVYMGRFTKIIHDNVTQRMLSTAELAAKSIVSGEELDNYWVLEDMDDRYEEIRANMQKFAEEHGLVYVYFMRKVGEFEEQMILDSDPEDPLMLDYVEDMDEHTSYVFTYEKSTCMDLGEYNASWYGIIAAYAPVFDLNGNLVAIVGVDIYDVNIVNTSRITNALTTTFFVCSIFLVVSAVALLSMFRSKAQAYENASIAKSEFLSRMSHEIRTPMNAIIGFARMADKSSNLEEIKQYLASIGESSSFLLELINGILDISKIEAGKMHLTKTAASPAAILDNIYSMLHNQAEAKNIKFVCQKEGKMPRFIYCDKIYLTQVIVNLLSNAIKFTPENGEVTASMKVLENTDNRCRIEFSVQDTGIGISKEFMKKLFEAFEQSDGGITRKYAGTGLGLNISKLLVALMGGDLKVESEEGKGSKFYFSAWFDIVKKESEMIEEVISKEVKTVDLTGKTVLVFEDNEINQLIAENALQELGATVEFADNGELGLQKYIADPTKYYLILMDIQMPLMDGYEATRRIRSSACANAHTIPIIAMSANVFREDVEASLNAGMDAHIGKPFEMDEMIATVYDVLKKQKS